MTNPRLCRDCVAEGVTTNRPIHHDKAGKPVPGPRCYTHHHAVRRKRKAHNRARYVERTYGLTPEQTQAVLDAQDGLCYACRRANGSTRALSVDHDHSCCPGRTSCGKCVRAGLCRPCNDVLGHVRDDIPTLRRFIEVVRDHPAQAVLNSLEE